MIPDERTPINVDFKASVNGFSSVIKFKNWPRCKPILRHNIQEDIPLEMQTLTRIRLLHVFYVIFFLLFNFFTAIVTKVVYVERLHASECRSSIVGSLILLCVWAATSIVSYICFYKTFSGRVFMSYWFYLFFTIIELVFCVLVIIGFWSAGFMGITVALKLEHYVGIKLMCFFNVFAFAFDAIFLVVSIVAAHIMILRITSAEKIVVAPDVKVSADLGTEEALPRSINGRQITYLPSNAGDICESKIEDLAKLPNDSFTIISEWRKVDSDYDDSYILYVENEPGRAYWSNPHVAGIINNGLVNPMTQVLTISKLSNGSFVFGTADKE